MLALMPIMAAAQNNIKSAFDAIIKCPDARITESHTLEKDPTTGIKSGQSDIYRFELPSNKAKLIDKVFSAFDKDLEKAYSVNRGNSDNLEREIVLAVGNGETDGVLISDPNCEYVYSLFLAPPAEDSKGIYRYAYGISFKEKGGKLTGKLVITYATTLKHRQQLAQQRQNDMFRNLSNGAYVINSGNVTTQQSWFDSLMSYFQGMTSANSQTRIALATKAYKVIHDTSKYPDVTDADKSTIREILKAMIADKEYSETVLNKLLHQCLNGIK